MGIFLVFYKVQLVSNHAKRHIIYNIGVFYEAKHEFLIQVWKIDILLTMLFHVK